jgi:hypothetical protein
VLLLLLLSCRRATASFGFGFGFSMAVDTRHTPSCAPYRTPPLPRCETRVPESRGAGRRAACRMSVSHAISLRRHSKFDERGSNQPHLLQRTSPRLARK